MANPLNTLRDFTPFMNQARLQVQSARGGVAGGISLYVVMRMEELLPHWNLGQLDAIIQQYEVGGIAWHDSAPRILEIDKLFKIMYPNARNEIPRGESLQQLLKLIGLVKERLPENYAPQPWYLPGGKKVSNLAQIWTDPSLGKLVGMIKRTAALFMRYLRGTYTSWKLAGLAHRENPDLLWGIFSEGYDLDWRKGSSDELVDWLISYSGQEEQFPKLRAALSGGVLFPEKGKHFEQMSFQPFFPQEISPGVDAMYDVLGRVREEIAPVNEAMLRMKEFFAASRSSRGEPNLEQFAPFLQGLLTACQQFENAIF